MSAEVRIRSAAGADLEALGALKLRASLAWGDHARALKAMPDARTVPTEHLPFVFLAVDGGRILGFATVLPSDAGAELEDLFVDPAVWRRGVGRRLMDEAARRALALGASSLHLIANPHAQGFYAACGFEEIGEAATELGPAVEMELRLAAGA